MISHPAGKLDLTSDFLFAYNWYMKKYLELVKKNKWIAAGVAAVVVVVGVAVFIFLSNSKSINPTVGSSEEVIEETVIEMTAEDIGLTLTSVNSNREIKMVITKLGKIKSLEGNFSYEKDEAGERVTDGAYVEVNEEEMKKAGGKIERTITLGTCSSGTCRYHKGVKQVDVEIRVNLKSNEIGLITDKLVLSD